MMKKTVLLIFTFVFFGIYLFADEVQFTASAPSTVAVGDSFYFKYTLNTRAQVSLPEFAGFSLLGGPSTSSSSSIQIINGQTTQSNTFSYSYVLQAKAEGSYTIPGASVSINGSNYTCNSVTIKVVKKGANPGGQNTNRGQTNSWGQNPNNNQTATSTEIKDDDIYISMDIDRTNIYQGEPILAELKIFTRLDLVGFKDYVLPDYNGFWVQEFEMPQQINLQRETVEGVVYNTAVLKKDLLFPQYSGKLTIKPAEVVCVVRQRMSGGNSPWDSFFGYYENKSVSIESEEVIINVKSLPDNAPGFFSGAVGNFSFKTEVSEDSVFTNDAITIKLVVSGTGNLKLIDPPAINFPGEFEVYEPEISLNINSEAGGSSGSKTFEYTLIPRYPGTYDLKNIKFAYFDPRSEKYKTLQSDLISIVVKRTAGDDSDQVSADYSKESIEYIGDEDIHFINTNSFKLRKGNKYFFGSFWFALLLFLPSALFISILVIWRKRIRESANIAKMRNKQANKISKKRLKNAKEFLNSNKREEFYKEIMNALWGYLGDKLDISVADLSKDNVAESLSERGIEENITAEFKNIIELCEFAHFAPITEETKMQNIYNEASDIINQLEQKLK